RLWRYLSPANAPSQDGTLELHVRAVDGGWVSRALVGDVRTGDQWPIGAAMGHLHVDRENDERVLIIACGTGLTPMRSIIEELAQYGTHPRVHLFYGGRTQEDLYALENLWQAAASNPWLTVTPVVENESELTG